MYDGHPLEWVPFFMRKRHFPSDWPHNELLDIAVHALRTTRRNIINSVRRGTGLRHPTFTAADGTPKSMLALDRIIEDECENILTERIGEKFIRVVGEEDLWMFPSVDFSKQRFEGYGEDVRLVEKPETRLVAIIDMIDGSDLVERNFGNWCSAIVLFNPVPQPKILFSMIYNAVDGTSDTGAKNIPGGNIYGSTDERTFLIQPNSNPGEPLQPLKGPEARNLTGTSPDKHCPLEDRRQITLCYYGQKRSHIEVPPGIVQWINESQAADRFRLYDLAGNPMMARLANGENIHAVFEHVGQHPHDAVPGAYIGLMAGASLVDCRGEKIEAAHLAEVLMKPCAAKLRYVLASTEELAIQVSSAIFKDSS